MFKTLSALSAITIALCAIVVPATAASSSFDQLDASQGLSFKKDKQTSFGWCKSGSLNGKALSTDLTATDPANGATDQVVAVLSSWSSGKIINVSMANETTAKMAAMSTAGATVALSCVVFSYDAAAKKYVRAIDTSLTGKLVKAASTGGVSPAAGQIFVE